MSNDVRNSDFVKGVDQMVELIFEIGKGLGKGGVSIALGGEGASSGASVDSSPSRSGEGFMASLGGLLKGSNGPSIEPARAPSQEITTPVVEHASYHADRADLGSFAPPTFGDGGGRSNGGISVA